MAVTVKKITLWRSDVQNKPGVLSNTLCPLADAGVDLQVLMGYHYSGGKGRAAIELYPVTGKKAIAAARKAGLRRLVHSHAAGGWQQPAGIGTRHSPDNCRGKDQYRLFRRPSGRGQVLRRHGIRQSGGG